MKRRYLISLAVSVALNIVLIGFLIVPSLWRLNAETQTAEVHIPAENELSGLPNTTHCVVTNHKYFYSTPTDIVFVGDSHTAYFEWGEMLPGLDVKNRGVMSETSEDLLDRVDAITMLESKKILIQIGTNDLVKPAIAALVTGGDPTELDMGAFVENAMGNYDAIISTLLSGCPEADIYVQSTPPFGENYSYLTGPVQALNDEIQNMCNRYGLTYIDLFGKLADERGVLKQEYSLYDGIHLTSAGYLVWVNEILPYCS